MAGWPRRISRGQLKGKTYNSEREYRQALRAALGAPSRHQQRNKLAQKLGFRNYSERRKVKETIGEGMFKAIKKKHGENVARLVMHESKLFKTSTTEQRRQRMKKYLKKYGADVLGDGGWMVWAALYHDAAGVA